jgi:tRNA modification GTPase
VIVVNKSDLAQVSVVEQLSGFAHHVSISAKHGFGIAALREVVVAQFGKEGVNSVSEGIVITERRHRDALLQAVSILEGLQVSVEALAPLECLAMELREALSALGLITGETTPDEILEKIFSQFCIGK